MGSLVPEYAGVKYPRIEKEGLQHPVPDDNASRHTGPVPERLPARQG